jgi:hypothetical protein
VEVGERRLRTGDLFGESELDALVYGGKAVNRKDLEERASDDS